MTNYVNIPGELLDEWTSGTITTKMFLVLVWLRSNANFKTGVVGDKKGKRVTAAKIRDEAWSDDTEDGRPSLRTVQELLYRLDKCGYITRYTVKGKKGSYKVVIHNYTALIKGVGSAQKEVVLNPKDTMDWHDLPKTRCTEDLDSNCAEASADAALTLQGGCAEASALSLVTLVSPVASGTPIPEKTDRLTDKRQEPAAPLLSSVPEEEKAKESEVKVKVKLKPEHQTTLVNFLCDRFPQISLGDRYELPRILWDKLLAAHPEFLWSKYNLTQLEAVLNRPGWKKSISDLGQLVFRWGSSSAGSLYAQVMELALNHDPDEDRQVNAALPVKLPVPAPASTRPPVSSNDKPEVQAELDAWRAKKRGVAAKAEQCDCGRGCKAGSGCRIMRVAAAVASANPDDELFDLSDDKD